jgi:hypothetical protein
MNRRQHHVQQHQWQRLLQQRSMMILRLNPMKTHQLHQHQLLLQVPPNPPANVLKISWQ